MNKVTGQAVAGHGSKRRRRIALSRIAASLALFVGVVSSIAENNGDQQAQQASGLSNKLDTIIFPELEFNQATITEIIPFLNTTAKENDTNGVGVKVVLDEAVYVDAQPTVTLTNDKPSLRKLLNAVAASMGLSIKITNGVVVLCEQEEDKKPTTK